MIGFGIQSVFEFIKPDGTNQTDYDIFPNTSGDNALLITSESNVVSEYSTRNYFEPPYNGKLLISQTSQDIPLNVIRRPPLQEYDIQ